MLRKIMVVATLVGFVAAGSAAGRIHTVRQGETLDGIGRRYGVDSRTLAGANGLRDPNFVTAGRALSIPAPRPTPVPKAPVAAAAAATRRAPAPGSLRETVVRMPPARLASVGRASRIIVPRDRAVLRNAFLRFSRLAGVPSDLAMALAWQESGWQRHRVSSTRAVGVMQLMPDTVEFVSVQLLRTKPLDPRDPIANIRMGTRFLRYLLDSNGGNVDRALASYYQGLRSVRERGMLPETEQFVANVKALRGRL
jgi:soluble lytic murein transglycosylase-like protein